MRSLIRASEKGRGDDGNEFVSASKLRTHGHCEETMSATKKTLTIKIDEMLDAMIEDGWNPNVFRSYDEWADWIAERVDALAKQKAAQAAARHQAPVPSQTAKATPAFKRAGARTAAQKKATADKAKSMREAMVRKGNPRKSR
jgi:hypothetical protein